MGTARVIINSADSSHDGVYECEATNAAGKDVKYTRVAVGRGDQRKYIFRFISIRLGLAI